VYVLIDTLRTQPENEQVNLKEIGRGRMCPNVLVAKRKGTHEEGNRQPNTKQQGLPDSAYLGGADELLPLLQMIVEHFGGLLDGPNLG